MLIHELRIKNFRGIKHLKWSGIPCGVVALIGPGDSCKTTVLDAVGVLFYGYWTLTLSENDFHNRDLTKTILVEATVVNPPPELTEDRQFLSYLRGVDAETGEIVDEPDDHLPALTIRFTMDAEFEPKWEIVCDRHDEGIRISGDKRRRFGVRGIDATSGDLRWGTRSPLRAITDSDDEHLTERVLRDAAKAARDTASKGLKALGRSAEEVHDAATLLRGARPDARFSAELDADLAAISKGSVSLHADDLPVERAGLGTRRLVSVAVESLSQSGAAVLLCDEVEIGLEPHRTRHLVRYLKSHDQQVLMTTHSPVVLRELQANQLVLLRRGKKLGRIKASCLSFPDDQGPIRRHAEAFLAQRIAVCEGLTEQGFVRETCADLEFSDPKRLSIAEPTNAGGDSKVVALATTFHRLGYQTAVVCDADTDLDISGLPHEVTPLRCNKGLCIEQQVLLNATTKGCIEAVRFAVETYDEALVRDHLKSAGLSDPVVLDALIAGDEATLANPPVDAVVKAATSRKSPWFKTIAGGERLAQLAADPSLIVQTSSLVAYLDALRDWCAPHALES